MKIGVLALQGAFKEHIVMLEKLNVQCMEVKCTEDLENLDGLIIPGGESTAIGKLIKAFGFHDAIRQFSDKGMHIWGTCAGLILLAKDIGEEDSHLNLMNISAKRNAYGSQLDSFNVMVQVPEVSDISIPITFIRAPIIESAGPGVDILLKYNNDIVAAREKNILVTAFHPELTDDVSWHQYFIDMIKG